MFTASLSRYAGPLFKRLDPTETLIDHCLYREHCTLVAGEFYVKDLSRLGRRPEDCIIIDNSPTSYMFQPDNALPCTSWYKDTKDSELLQFTPVLEKLAQWKGDVRDVLKKISPKTAAKKFDPIKAHAVLDRALAKQLAREQPDRPPKREVSTRGQLSNNKSGGSTPHNLTPNARLAKHSGAESAAKPGKAQGSRKPHSRAEHGHEQQPVPIPLVVAKTKRSQLSIGSGSDLSSNHGSERRHKITVGRSHIPKPSDTTGGLSAPGSPGIAKPGKLKHHGTSSKTPLPKKELSSSKSPKASATPKLANAQDRRHLHQQHRQLALSSDVNKHLPAASDRYRTED